MYARIYPWRRTRRSRAPSNGPDAFFVARFSAGYTTNVFEFDLRQGQRFGFELRPPIAESLERNPLRFAILSLIQRALLPHLMVLAPESLAVTLTGSKFVGHVVSSLFENSSARTDRVRTARKQPCKKWTLTFLGCNSLIPFKNSLILKLFSLIVCLGNCSRSGCSAAVSWH
jgi:hypothetical protein